MRPIIAAFVAMCLSATLAVGVCTVPSQKGISKGWARRALALRCT
jgi:hypothetical protein